MTTTAPETAAEPVLGEIHVTAQGILWTLGHTAIVRGLTAAGRAAATQASAEFLGGLSDAQNRAMDHRAGRHHVRVSAHEWVLPLPPGMSADDVAAAAALMTSVINGPGAIGQVG